MNKKVIFLIYVFLITIFLWPINVLAKEGIILELDKTDLTINDEVVVQAKATKKLDSYALIATLKYDHNVFQKIDETDFTIGKDASISYNAANNKFGIINKTGEIATEGFLFSVRLKVKENASIGNTNIALTNISSSDGNHLEEYDVATVKALITRNAAAGEEIPSNSENDITADAEETIKTFTNLPIIIGASVVAIALLIYIISYKNKKAKNTKIFGGLIALEVITLVTIIALLIVNCHKKDVNNDGIKDYNDAEEIIKYLIDIEGTKEEQKENNTTAKPNVNKPSTKPKDDYDVNNDGKVDIEDAGHVTEDVTKNIKVKLHEQNEESEYYLEKGLVKINFKAEITPNEFTITQVKVNNKYYDVTLNDNVYDLLINTPKEAGKWEFTISEVLLSNGKKIKTNLKITREVLKTRPYINNVNLDDTKGALSFNLVDEENAFIKGQATIYDGDKIIKQQEITKVGAITFTDIPVNEDITYELVIIGDYDLDSKLDKLNNYYEDETILEHQFVMGGHYDFSLTDVKITDVIDPDEIPIITFKSDNVHQALVESAKITNDNKTTSTYQISQVKENTYEAQLSGVDVTPGKHTISLDSVRLDTLKTFTNNKDYQANTLTYTVVRKAPRAEEIALVDNREAQAIEATFKLNDPHQAISRLVVALVDSTNKIASQKEYSLEELKALTSDNFKVSLAYNNSTDGVYKVVVYADFALTDKYYYTNVNIGEKDIISPKDIIIRDMYLINKDNGRVESPYITKDNSAVAIAMEVVIGDGIKNYRAYSGISYVTINGLNYPINTLKSPDKNNGAYLIKVLINMPKEAGVYELKANRLQLSNNAYYHIYSDYFAFAEKSLTIEVLKDKPQINNLKVVEEDYDRGEVTFDFDVTLDAKASGNDNSFIAGTLVLDGENGEPSTIYQAGSNRVTFKNVKPDEALDLVFKANFDLDTNTLDQDQNEFNEEIFHTKYTLLNKEAYQDVTIINGTINKNYFEKNEKIKLNFDLDGKFKELGMEAQKVVINNAEYALTKTSDGYEVIMDGYHSYGQKELTITDVIFDYNRKVNLNESYTFKMEVLKDIVKLNNIEYTIDEENIKIIFSALDPDASLVNANIVITDEKGQTVYNNTYKTEITIPRENGTLRYFVKVIGDYDRDIDKTIASANYHADVTLLDEILSLDQNNIELKDIMDINLYKLSNDGVYDEITRIDEITYQELKANLDAYFVEVVMENMPSVRTRIKDVVEKENHLYLVLDFTYVTQEGKIKANDVSIDFGEINAKGLAKNEFHPEVALKKLLTELNNNQDVTLKQNYDFAKIDIEGLVYVESYSGSLDGNGFTLKNLNKPLFNKLTGEVKNLNIINATFDGNGHGALANYTENAVVSKVLADNIKRTSGGSGQTGGLLGSTVNTKVDSCRATNVIINAGGYEQQNGLLIGSTNGNVNASIVTNCYAEGRINGGYNFTSGFIGECKSTTVKNNYVKVTAGGHAAGFGAAWVDKNSIYENNISIASGAGTTMIGNSKTRINNYYYLDKEAPDADGVKVITTAEINDNLFLEKAQFDPSIWYIKDVSINNLPVFQSEKKSVLNDTSSADYKREKENLYQNLTKLMPYYDSNKIISLGKNITDSNLVNKTINHILPLDQNNNLVTYLTINDVRKIAKLRIVFTDKTKVDYQVKYDKTYDMVATYRILDLGIDYNYRNYVIDANSQIVNNLTNYLQNLDYATNLDILTTNNDSRIYKDFYHDVTSKELKEFVLKYLANSDYPNTSNDSVINDYLEREIKKNQALEKALYTYNYFRRFYDVEIGNMKLYDLMMFNMQGFNQDLTPSKITELFFSDKSGANFSTNLTSSKYASVFGSYTKINDLADFLEYVVTTFSDETNMARWVKNQFKGILVELPVVDHPEIQYTLWDHFKNLDKSYPNGYLGHWSHEFILPILTLPENAAYIISCPVEFIIGSQRTYMSDPTDAQQVADFQVKLNSYTTRLQTYFTTAYGILNDQTLFNNMHLFILDKRNTKNIDGSGVYNNPYSTTEPFHKNFDEILGLWPAAAGNNAAAWGYYIEMQVAGVLDSTLATDGTLDQGHVTFKTLTHESAHNLDDRLFFKNNGQRGGGEDYADAFLMQSFEKFGIVMNLSINFDLAKLNAKNQAVGSNLTPERINTEAKISDFYQKAFEAIYTVDYLEAQAFLQLTSEEQAKLAIQIDYPNAEKEVKFKDSDGKEYTEYVDGNNEKQPLVSQKYKDDPYAQNAAYSLTQYTKLNLVDGFDFSKLQTIDDLIDQKIMLYPNKEGVTTLGPGRYGGEGYNVAHWYQPHNDYGFPDSYSFKWISYEMLGYAGYTNGFIEYASNTNTVKRQFYSSLDAPINKDNGHLALTTVNYKSDASALNTITKGEFTDFDKYKKARFAEIANKLNYLNQVVNAKAYVQKFYDALKLDASDSKTAISLANSTEVRYQIYSTLKNETNDFLGNVYMKEWQQDASDLKVSK